MYRFVFDDNASQVFLIEVNDSNFVVSIEGNLAFKGEFCRWNIADLGYDLFFVAGEEAVVISSVCFCIGNDATRGDAELFLGPPEFLKEFFRKDVFELSRIGKRQHFVLFANI